VTRVRTALSLKAVSGLCLVASASASASVGEVTEFSTGITANSAPSQITVGPEGDL
jgi:hypothetical protein